MTPGAGPVTSRRSLSRSVGWPAGLLAVVASGCAWLGGDDGAAPSPAPDVAVTEAADPCPDAEEFDLGSPTTGGDVSEFTAAEHASYWISARDFSHGGMFDPDVWRTTVYIGSQEVPPTYDAQRSRVTGADVEVDVVEETWSRVELDAGAHWVWAISGGSILIKSCEGLPITDVRQAADP